MKPWTRPVTLREIAQAAGFSRSTVSLALRSHPAITAATQDKVRAVAESLGWRPNPLVSAAMSHRRGSAPAHQMGTIGLITAWDRPRAWERHTTKPAASPHEASLFPRISSSIIAGMQQRAFERGFEIEEFWLREKGVTPARLGQILTQRQLQALIIAPLPMSHAELALPWHNFSAVTLGYSLLHPQLDTVTTHHVLGMEILLRQIKERGFRRPALILSHEENNRVRRLWSTSYQGLVREYFPALPAKLVSPWLGDHIESSLVPWVRQHQADVLICCPAEPVALCFKKMSLPPPPILSLYMQPWHLGHYAGLRSLEREMGAECVDLVIGRLLANQRGLPEARRVTMIEPVWQEGPGFSEKLGA